MNFLKSYLEKNQKQGGWRKLQVILCIWIIFSKIGRMRNLFMYTEIR